MTVNQVLARLRRPLPIIAAALAAVGLQTAALGHLLWDRISILRSETEITLRPEPVDPRDLFRGDYVILRYGVSRWVPDASERPSSDDAAPPPRAFEPGETVWAVIETRDTEAGDAAWSVRDVARARPKAPPEGAVVLQARAHPRSQWIASELRDAYELTYGLERYYVPEGEGRALERLVGDARIEVVVAVAADGRAAIKALQVDGARVYEEPLF